MYALQRRNDKFYTVKFEYKGKQKWKKTPCTNKEEAERWGRNYRATLDRGDWSAINKAALRKTPNTYATIRQAIAAYQQFAGPALNLTNAATIKGYTAALRNVLARARNLDPGDLDAETEDQLLDTSTQALNTQLIHAYKANTLERAKTAEDDQDAQSIYRSANSLLTNARALFTPAALEQYKTAGLHLPDLTPFNTTPKFELPPKVYTAASDPLIAKTFAALPQLEQTHLNAYLAIWLTIGFALRKSEIAHVTPHSFRTVDGRPRIHLIYKTKNHDVLIDLPCQLDAWQRLQPHIQAAAAARQPYLLAGTMTARVEDAFRAVSDWMRNLGWSTQKTIHEFRAWSGCQIAKTHGLLAASKFLRHKHLSTTQNYYGRYLETEIAHVPLQIPSLQAPTILQISQQTA